MSEDTRPIEAPPENDEQMRASGMVDMTLAAELVDIYESVRIADEQLKSLKRRQAELSEMLLPQLEEANVQRLNVAGRTIYRSSTWRASVPADKREAVCSALESIGLADLITTGVNAQTLSAQVREWLAEDGDGIPECLRDLISTYNDKSLRVLSK